MVKINRKPVLVSAYPYTVVTVKPLTQLKPSFFSFSAVNPGLLGHGPGMNNMNNMTNMNMNMQMPMNGYPPSNPPGVPRFNHPPPPPHHQGPPFSAGGGPRMMGPPPGQGRGDNGSYWGDESMRGGPHRGGGGHFHRGGRGRGGDQGFRGRGRGGLRGGHNMNGESGMLSS